MTWVIMTFLTDLTFFPLQNIKQAQNPIDFLIHQTPLAYSD